MYTMTSGWQLHRVSGPEIEPVTLLEVKAHAKIDPDITGDDETIEGTYIPAAREAVEDYTSRTMCETTYQVALDDFPRGIYNRLYLPRGPVVAVLGVSYLQNDGTRLALLDGQWLEGLRDVPSWIAPPYNEFWPSGRQQGGSVVIEYRAGYPGVGSPPDASKVPKRAKQTILAICTRWIENREMTNVDDLLDAGVFTLRVFAS